MAAWWMGIQIGSAESCPHFSSQSWQVLFGCQMGTAKIITAASSRVGATAAAEA